MLTMVKIFEELFALSLRQSLYTLGRTVICGAEKVVFFQREEKKTNNSDAFSEVKYKR